MFQRKNSPIVVSVYLVVRGPVVWIPRIPLWKGLLLRGTPIRIPNHRAPNQQFTIEKTGKHALAIWQSWGGPALKKLLRINLQVGWGKEKNGKLLKQII